MLARGCQYVDCLPAPFLKVRDYPVMGLISVFFDESGKFRDKRVVSLAGLFANEQTVGRFSSKWQELLRRHNLPYFKASQAWRAHRAMSDVIPKQSPGERLEALKPFAACIGENFEFALAVTVNVEAFQRTKDHIKKAISGGDDPFYFSFLKILMAALERSNGARLSLVCDDDQHTAFNCFKLYRRVKNSDNEAWRIKLSAITFADDKSFPALQAADMVSGLFRREGARRFFGEPYDYFPLIAYMAEDRGPMMTQWGNAFVGELAMAKIDMAWKSPKFLL